MGETKLFPTFEVPEVIAGASQYEEKYKPSLAWDMEKGDFVRDGANQLVACEGIKAYQIWCYKTSNTERFACLSYTTDLGTEMEDALKEQNNEAVESAVERTITEALLVNPRTEHVRGFTFFWEGDRLTCSFIVKGIDWEEFSLRVAMGRQGDS